MCSFTRLSSLKFGIKSGLCLWIKPQKAKPSFQLDRKEILVKSFDRIGLGSDLSRVRLGSGSALGPVRVSFGYGSGLSRPYSS